MIDVTIHSTGTGTCGLSGKTGSGVTISFKDGTIREGFLSFKAFQQLLRLKLGQNGTAPATTPPSTPPVPKV